MKLPVAQNFIQIMKLHVFLNSCCLCIAEVTENIFSLDVCMVKGNLLLSKLQSPKTCRTAYPKVDIINDVRSDSCLCDLFLPFTCCIGGASNSSQGYMHG